MCFTYLRVVLDVGMLVDKQIYFDNMQKLRAAARCKSWLYVVTALVILMSIAIGLATGFQPTAWVTELGYWYLFLYTSQWASFALVTIFLLVWGVSLCLLNRKIKRAEQLMPNRTLFCVHGLLLVVFLLS